MKINIERIKELNERFKDVGVNLSTANCITQKDFNDLAQFGTMWNFNFMSASIWFNENKVDHELEQLLNNESEKAVEKHQRLLDYIKDTFIELNVKVSKDKVLNKEVLEEYLPLLKEHQKVARSADMVNRWGYTTNIDPLILENVIEQCKLLNGFVSGEILRKEIYEGDRLDGNHFMRYAWMCIEWGLYDEAMFIVKSLIDLGEHINNVANKDTLSLEDRDVIFMEKELDIMTTCSRLEDIRRFELSVKVAYGKVLAARFDDETAIDVYRSCIAMFPFNEYKQNEHIHYWTGQTRIIEMTIEAWILESNPEFKDLIKDAIEEMFFKMRELDTPNNNREAVYEHLLVCRMLLDTVYA